jgi:hypothetical protein
VKLPPCSGTLAEVSAYLRRWVDEAGFPDPPHRPCAGVGCARCGWLGLDLEPKRVGILRWDSLHGCHYDV